ncbi:MAG: VanZ family protein [Candidatus Poribacteria bacterium]
MSSIPPKSIPDIKTEMPIDKLVHLIEYGILGFLLFNSLYNLNKLRVWQIIIIVIYCGAFLGALDEFYQRLTKRTSSIYDWIADVSGIIIALIFIVSYIKVFKKDKIQNRKQL